MTQALERPNARINDPAFRALLRTLNDQGLSLSGISQALAGAGYTTSSSRHFSAAYVGYALRRIGINHTPLPRNRLV